MAIYVGRGLEPALAQQVAEQLMAHDALGAHARDELGITETLSARPLQAANGHLGAFRGFRGTNLPADPVAPGSPHHQGEVRARIVPCVRLVPRSTSLFALSNIVPKPEQSQPIHLEILL